MILSGCPLGHTIRAATAGLFVLGLSACTEPFDAPLGPEREDPNLVSSVVDDVNLNDLMLTVADPKDGVAYFRDALSRDPDRPDLKRGYALSLARARRHADAVIIFEELSAEGHSDAELRLEHANSLARLERWDEAENQMALVGSDVEVPRRYLIDAMLADHRGDWDQSDAAYERARRLSANPAAILNNWGVSRLSRKDYGGAQKTFEQALAHDPSLFSIKNNLAVSRALQGEYRLPLVSINDEERATLLHNVGVIALRRGETEVAKGLFAKAVETHPRYYPSAAEKLAALNANVIN
ncbi:MAG: tetratricopeptide repeat protein [Pseudomonadota bacterium]